MDSYNYILTSDGELYHHGIKGMKWGVRKATRKSNRNVRLGRKALEYDAKSAKFTKRSEKAHSKNDLGRDNRTANSAAKYDMRAAK